MIEALKEAFPMLLGLALSPFPLIAIIIILMTPKAKSNSLWFLLGWIFGIYSIGLLVLIIPGLGSNSDIPSIYSGGIRIALGLSLLIIAFKKWLNRPRSGDEIVTPKMFLSIDKFGLRKSMLTGFLFSAANVKNMAFSAAGSLRINQSLAGNESVFIALLLFSLIGSLTLIFPIIIYAFTEKKIEPTFLIWKKWLIKNNAILLVFMLGIVGLILVKGGIEILKEVILKHFT